MSREKKRRKQQRKLVRMSERQRRISEGLELSWKRRKKDSEGTRTQ